MKSTYNMHHAVYVTVKNILGVIVINKLLEYIRNIL